MCGCSFARQGWAIEAVDTLEQGLVRCYGSLTAVPSGLRLRHDNGSIFLARRFVRTTHWLHHFESFEEAEQVITAWIERDNTERQHSALGYLTPRAWREQFYQLPQAA